MMKYFWVLALLLLSTQAAKTFFFEDFEGDTSDWIQSSATKSSSDDHMKYEGEWAFEHAHVLPGNHSSTGLVVKSANKLHAVSAQFEPITFSEDHDLIVQYEVKLQDNLQCGGAYLKLLSQNDEFIGELFDDKAPYTIMFGPDKCGRTNKVHFIFRHKNPKTGEIEEKHLKNAPEIKSDSLTNLYTLIIHGSDNTYEIKINSEQVRKGSLFEDFEPPVNPPEMIDDPEDKKPEDWVDVAKIPDPTATKPDDWDEDAPYQIEDLSAEKPYDWLDNEPELIPDPEAFKPDDWDDEDDGAWEAPIVENPKCKEVSGCGEWQRPMKKNPAYKGKWKAPMIDNPAYKGEWKPRLIPNPNYFKDDHPARFTPIGAIGFELWTLQANILFDNILITDDVTLAEEYASKYWAPKQESEIAERDKDKPSALGGFLESAQEQMLEFFTEFQTDPLNTLKEQPVAALVVFLLPVLIFLIILAACIPSSAPEPLPRRPVPRETPKAEGGEEKQDSKDSQESKTSKDAKDSKDEKNK